jgi:hypothetical protein
MPGGGINIAYEALDRHLDTPTADQHRDPLPAP